MNKDGLVRVKDKISFVYVEKSTISMKDFSVVVCRNDAVIDLSIATISVLILGVGVSITHEAVVDISKYGCTIIWSGMNLNRFYTFGCPSTNNAKSILHQCKCYESKCLKLLVIRNMYHLRYPNERLKSKCTQELLGLEGVKMQECYARLSKTYHIDWKGRIYHVEDFDSQDMINKCITSANQLLYSIVTAVVVSMGYSTAIGFIHKGNMMSFVYDVADLYKESIVLPYAFEYCGSGNCELDKLRDGLFVKFCEINLMEKIVNDLHYIFYNGISDDDVDYEVKFEKI